MRVAESCITFYRITLFSDFYHVCDKMHAVFFEKCTPWPH